HSSALTASLRTLGVIDIQPTRPKQTDTTQRWKVLLRLSTSATLSTQLEFSRRGMDSGVKHATPAPELLRSAYLAPFAIAFYDGAAMVRQKLRAISSPSRTAARDLFDLHHLLVNRAVPLEGYGTADDLDMIRHATSKIKHFTNADFRDQVLPYL